MTPSECPVHAEGGRSERKSARRPVRPDPPEEPTVPREYERVDERERLEHKVQRVDADPVAVDVQTLERAQVRAQVVIVLRVRRVEFEDVPREDESLRLHHHYRSSIVTLSGKPEQKLH